MIRTIEEPSDVFGVARGAGEVKEPAFNPSLKTVCADTVGPGRVREGTARPVQRQGRKMACVALKA